jgi:hypothetical protein
MGADSLIKNYISEIVKCVPRQCRRRSAIDVTYMASASRVKVESLKIVTMQSGFYERTLSRKSHVHQTRRVVPIIPIGPCDWPNMPRMITLL